MKVGIVGYGAWGQALYSVLRQNTESIAVFQRGDIISRCEIVLLCVPVQAIRIVLPLIANPDAVTIVNTAKGIEQKTNLLPYQIVEQVLGKKNSYYSLMGPSFAQEVVDQMPTLVNLGYFGFGRGADEVKKLFQTDYFRVRMTNSIEALELAGAFKNIYAISCGMADGLGYGTNTRVKLMVLAMEEMQSLFKKQRLKLDTNALPGTLGDLILTCSSSESRNFSFGRNLTKYSVEEALKKSKGVVEGYFSRELVLYFQKKYRVAMPLAQLAEEIIYKDNPKHVKSLFDTFVQCI